MKKSMAKAVFAFALSMAGTIAGNLIYQHIKNKHDAELDYQEEWEDWEDDILEEKSDIQVNVPNKQQKTDETVWGFMANHAEEEPKQEQPESKAEII